MLLAEMGKSTKALPALGLQLFHNHSAAAKATKITIARFGPVVAGFDAVLLSDVSVEWAITGILEWSRKRRYKRCFELGFF
jgi:hypothetical protein